jgi:hypothetical protein
MSIIAHLSATMLSRWQGGLGALVVTLVAGALSSST